MTTIGYNAEHDLFLKDEDYKGEPWKEEKDNNVEIKCQYCDNTILRRYKNLFTCLKCKKEKYKHWTKEIRQHTCTICRKNMTINKYCDECMEKLKDN